MTYLRCVILLRFTTILVLGQLTQSRPQSLPKQSETMVRSLYSEVVARHPVGIPRNADMKVFAPYLSKALLHRIDSAIGCETDEARQRPEPNLKPQIEWLEFGLFTGGNEKVSPRTFHVEKAQSDKNGSFRVNVRFTWGATASPWIWHVTAIVVRQGGRFVVDDVIFLKDENTLEDESRLSDVLAAGCDGPRWVGYRGERNDLK
jgi:hypothetical protein